MRRSLLGLVLLVSQVGWAGTGYLFNVSVNGGTLGITSVANHTYPNAGIKITSPGYTLANAGKECKPNANGYCLFSVSQSAPATITVAGSGGPLNVTLCLNGAGPISCQNYDNLAVAKIAKTAYVTNNVQTPTVFFCSVNQSTGALQNCQNAGADSYLTGDSPQGIAVNNLGTTAYITTRDLQPYVYQCSINASGTFNSCAAIQITTPTGYAPNRGQITLNSANTLAYFVDDNNNSPRLLACPIVSGSFSGNCTDTGATNIGANGTEIALNSASTTAYVAGETNGGVTVCNVSGNGTIFTGCTLKTGFGSTTFLRPEGVALNNTETTLYVVDNTSGEVYGCSTTPSGGGTFTSCFIADANIPDASSITLNAANTIAYITDLTASVYSCPINTNGTFGTCVMNSEGFNEPVAIALGY